MSHGIDIAAQAVSPGLNKLLQAALTAATASPTPSSIPAAHEVRARANSAVDQCCAAYNQAREAAIAANKSSYSIDKAAEHAYRCAMPPLDSEINIRDFVACVTHALLIGAFTHNESSRLLYAAQVANSVLKNAKSSRAPGRPPASAEDNPASPAVNQSITSPVLEN